MASSFVRRTGGFNTRGRWRMSLFVSSDLYESTEVKALLGQLPLIGSATHDGTTLHPSPVSGVLTRSYRSERSDRGATLILALVFLVVSLVAGALVQWAGGDLTATSQFTSAHKNESAANGANAIAEQFVRYNFISSSLFASPPVSCWSTSGSSNFQLSSSGPIMSSWCSTISKPFSANSRVVTISTCPAGVSNITCAATPYLQTIVTIDDISQTTGITSCAPTSGPVSNSGRTCGKHLTLNSWAFGVTPPTVTNVSNGVANCGATSKSIVITGTGLGQTTQVFFIVVGSNPLGTFVATSFSVPGGSTTTVNACTPSTTVIPTGNAYVVVQTPTGSNWYGPGPPSSQTITW
jgi:hypothetical protein